MPGFRRPRRFSYGRYRKYRRIYRRYRRYYGGSSKYVNATSRSQVRVKVPVHFVHSVTQNSGATYTECVPCCLPFTSSRFKASPLAQNLYKHYSQLYEEVRCIGARVKIAVSSPIGGAEIPALRIISAWDRRWHHGERMPIVPELVQQGSANTVTCVNNSVAKLTRSCWASDLIEKAQWHDCTLNGTDDAGYWVDKAYQAAGPNCNFFSPGLNVGFQVEGRAAAAQVSLTFSCDVMYYFAFRCPKHSTVSDNTSAKSAASDAVDPDALVRRAPAPPDDDDMDAPPPDDGGEAPEDDPDDVDYPIVPSGVIRDDHAVDMVRDVVTDVARARARAHASREVHVSSAFANTVDRMALPDGTQSLN